MTSSFDVPSPDERVSRRRVAKIMREAGIRGKTPRAFKITTDSKHQKPIAENLAERRTIDHAVLVYTDRGVQYASDAVQRYYGRHEMVCSMSCNGNCWDNALTESFFATLKRELNDPIFETRETARAIIFEYIEIWYNRQRRHSTLGYVSPEQFEKNQAA